jgi:hypothetical protein
VSNTIWKIERDGNDTKKTCSVDLGTILFYCVTH